MLSWLRRRPARIERVEAEAEALIRDLGLDAYSEARRRERASGEEGTAEDWRRVALGIARKTGKRIGFDTSSRMAMNVVFAPDRPARVRVPRSLPQIEPVEELERILSAPLQPFRIQFIGAGQSGTTVLLKEVEIEASGVSAAIVAAANEAWPIKTTRLRILDREGREVFDRQRADPGQDPM
jgi:hypothetical protein